MRWEDLMPYTMGAFAMFGLGSLPAGRLGHQLPRNFFTPRAMPAGSSPCLT
jgi:hypothetical protein